MPTCQDCNNAPAEIFYTDTQGACLECHKAHNEQLKEQRHPDDVERL